MIGFPGALLAAYALRQHTHKRIAPLQVPHIVRTLRFAGLLLAGYAILAGLIPPPVPFFPGNIINDSTFEQILIVPVPVFRSIIGLGLALAIIRALEVFNLETARMIDAMEQKQILLTERDRLGRELHDGAIQKVYTAGLLVESAQKLASQENPQLSTRLEKAETVLNDAIRDLRRNLGELREPTDVQKPFPEALRNLIEDPRFRSLVDMTVDIDLPEAEGLSSIRTGHVLSIVNEALSNIARHSKASRAKVTARSVDGRLQIIIEDNGIGIRQKEGTSYGLRNMRDRARLLGGQITFSSLNGKGTRVFLDIPWRDER
jgi:signal transduction histidine kinase